MMNVDYFNLYFIYTWALGHPTRKHHGALLTS